MESVAATSTPDPAKPPWRVVVKRPGRTGLAPLLLVIFFPHMWIGIGLVGAGVGQLVFPHVAQTVTAHVDNTAMHTSKKSGDSYTMDVAFRLDDVDEHETLRLSAPSFATVHQGDEVTIRAAHLGGFTMARSNDDSDIPSLLFVALFWNGIVGVFLKQFVWVPLLRFWLVKTGQRVEGDVDEVIRTTGKGAAVLVRYHFTPVGGDPENGRMKVSVGVFDEAPLPRRPTVFFHRRWPSFSVIGELTSWEPR